MNFLQKIKPEWPLRLGLGLMYIYSGYDLFTTPTGWLWAIPPWFAKIVNVLISTTFYLKVQGVGEIIMGLLFLAWFSGKWGVRVASILAVIEMAAILLLTGIDPITFRDIGLLGAALALTIISFKEGYGSNQQI